MKNPKETKKKLVDAFAENPNVAAACAAAGTSRNVFYHHLQRDPFFRSKILQIERKKIDGEIERTEQEKADAEAETEKSAGRQYIARQYQKN